MSCDPRCERPRLLAAKPGKKTQKNQKNKKNKKNKGKKKPPKDDTPPKDDAPPDNAPPDEVDGPPGGGEVVDECKGITKKKDCKGMCSWTGGECSKDGIGGGDGGAVEDGKPPALKDKKGK